MAKELKTTCQKCGRKIEIYYDKWSCSVFERRLKTKADRKREAFPQNKFILKPHKCTNPCVFPNSEDCCEYDEGSCKVGHCIDEVYCDNN